MASWHLVDEDPLFSLSFYQSDHDFMIRSNGLELMNSRWHQSEDLLGELSSQLSLRKKPKILIGGLGLGFTLRSASIQLGTRGFADVVEVSLKIINWYDKYIKPIYPLDDKFQYVIHHDDFMSFVASSDLYDCIALDIDNGPEPFSRGENAIIYTGSGMRRLSEHLVENGCILIWSSFLSAEFIENATAHGFHIEIHNIGHPQNQHIIHYIYVLRMINSVNKIAIKL